MQTQSVRLNRVPNSNAFRNHVESWHPFPSKFGRTIAVQTALDAMREGDILREKLRGRRILETRAA